MSKKYKVTGECGGECPYAKVGDIIEPACVHGSSIYVKKGGGSGSICSHGNAWELKIGQHCELITNKSNMSNLKEKFVQIFLSEPEKSFRKAGITNSDGILTEEGQEVFLTWVLKKYGPEFKTDVVDPLLAEEKE